MKALRPLTASLLLAALLTACGQPAPQEQTERPFQVTPAPATPGPGSFGSGTPQGDGAYPAPAAGTDGYPAPAPVTDSAYPEPAPAEETFGRAETALESLPTAEAVAKAEFSPEARLIALMPSRVMIRNLGGPPVKLGWFYTFKAEGSPREFIVQVADGVATGSVETEAVEPPQPAMLPIPVESVTVDSDQVYARLEQRAGELGVTVTDPRAFDLELVNLEGSAGPVWSVYDPDSSRWLLSVDGASGEEVPNPRS